ncbi:MAG: tryptophan--tRNA ligase [Gammaproteobacteria bacterium]|nr:tryptophan--tRNA ligase [Gammaproteobacteria bacterium]MCY3988239.1 tryptophan--tRNA ligase [Gammaproteobacteria bacterium]
MNGKNLVTLTGITTTGTPHLGNYVGAIRPAVEASRSAPAGCSFFFLADFHALVKNRDADEVAQSSLEVAAAWLAAGLDTENAVFYRQSDIPEIPELTWVLTTLTAKGLMNRSHAYKAANDANREASLADLDRGVTMGLFCYPILMAADILMFKADRVPVGKDQRQHVEMARDIAQRFNHHYGELLTVPQADIDEHRAVLLGPDGRKMSKSYGNVVPLFCPAKQLRKYVMRVRTNSQAPGEPKDPDDSLLFDLYRSVASPEETAAMRERYAAGIGWAEMKNELYEYLDALLAPGREVYDRLIANPGDVEAELKRGAGRAREISEPLMKDIRHAVGLRALKA